MLQVCVTRIPRLKRSLPFSVDYNAGCGVKLTEDSNNFGPSFNNMGGGW